MLPDWAFAGDGVQPLSAEGSLMPWTPEQFRARHNRKLSLAEALSASRQAEAMMRGGVPEGEAIATANKRFSHRTSLADVASGRMK